MTPISQGEIGEAMYSILVYILILAPVIANVAYAKGIKFVTIFSAAVATGISVTLLLIKSDIITPIFFVTQVTKYFIVMVASIYLLSSIFSINYLSKEQIRISERVYYILLNFFAASMFFSLAINNLGLMWVGIEATTISTILLVMTEGTDSVFLDVLGLVVISAVLILQKREHTVIEELRG